MFKWCRSIRGTSEDVIPANKYRHATFCSSQIRYLGQSVGSFLLAVSRELCFASSSLGDKWKTFWLSLQGERAWRRNFELCQRETVGVGGHVNKTISCHYNSVWGSIFMLHWGTCCFSWNWFDTAPFAREVDCCMFPPLLNVTFSWHPIM